MVAWNELPSIGEPAEHDALVELAERVQWSAPELTVQYARRAIVEGPAAGGPGMIRAYGLLSAALVRIGRFPDAVEPALTTLRWADQAGLTDVASLARLDLAECARELGEPLVGCTILRPVLDTTGGHPATRAGAIWQLAGCTVHVGRRDDLEDLLTEADRLLAADDRLSPDARRIERGLLAARTAAYHRRYGETEEALDTAREGLGLLTRLRDRRIEGGRVWARLTLELVLALLDDGQPSEAEHEAGPLFARPVRAAAAPAVGRTLLAVATRVMVPVGRVGAARGLLDYVLSVAERHALDWLLADALSLRADLDERSARLDDALDGLRGAHAAEHRHRRSVELARRQLVIEFGLVDAGVDAITLLLRNVARTQVAVPAGQPVPPLATQAPVADPIPAPPNAGAPATPGSTAAPGGAERTKPAPSKPDEPTLAAPAADDPDQPVALTLVRLDLSGAQKPGHPAGSAGEPAADATPKAPGEPAAPEPDADTGIPDASGAPTGNGPAQPPAVENDPATRAQSVPDRPETEPGDAPPPGSASDQTDAPVNGPVETDPPGTGPEEHQVGVPVPGEVAVDPPAATEPPKGWPDASTTGAEVPAAAEPGGAGPGASVTGPGASDAPATASEESWVAGNGVPRPGGPGGAGSGGPVAGAAGLDVPVVDGPEVGPLSDLGGAATDPDGLAGVDAAGESGVLQGGPVAGATGLDVPVVGGPQAGVAPDSDGSAGGSPGGIGALEPAVGGGIGPAGGGTVDEVEGVGAVAPPGSERTGYQEPGTTNWLIRDLLAPLLHHPTLASKELHDTVPPEPPPDDIPEPPGQPDVTPRRPDGDPSEPGGEPPAPNRPDFAPKEPSWPGDPAERPKPGGVPGKPDDEGKPPRRPDIILPEEPDQIPPISPIPEPTRDVPPPAQLAPSGEPVATSHTVPAVEPNTGSAGPYTAPVVEPEASGGTGPGTGVGAQQVDPGFVPGPVGGPGTGVGAAQQVGPPGEPGPGPSAGPGRLVEPDTERLAPVEPPEQPVPERVHRRRERTDSISIADLLTEALVAYQATGSNDDDEEPPAEPAEPAPDTTAPARRFSPGSGRHRMPDWGNV